MYVAAKDGKFSGSLGLFSTAPLNIAPEFQETAVQLLNSSRAEKSWRLTRAVRNKIAMAQQTMGGLTLPWTQSDVHNFILFCHEQNLRASTIRTYVSQIRTIHLTAGCSWSHGTDPLSKLLLKGIHHVQPPSIRAVAVTPDLLYQLKLAIKRSGWDHFKKRMVWATSCLLFAGSMRSGELLAEGTHQFCPDRTLLNRNILIKEIVVDGKTEIYWFANITSPKSGSEVVIEFLKSDNWFCPIHAVTKYLELLPFVRVQDQPLIRRRDGWCYSQAEFARDLKELLGPVIGDLRVVPHSFRAGVTSALARAGANEEQLRIQACRPRYVRASCQRITFCGWFD